MHILEGYSGAPVKIPSSFRRRFGGFGNQVPPQSNVNASKG